jgi:hypothetical protein
MMALAVLALATATPPPQPPLPPAPHTIKAPAVAAPTWLLLAGGQAQVMADFQAAQAKRGSLEGRWRLANAGGIGLYLFQLADPGGLPDPRAARPNARGIEGAWLDLSRKQSPDGVGLLASVRRDQGHLTLTFVEGPARATRTIVLQAVDGAWRGGMTIGQGTAKVSMTREPALGPEPTRP